MNNTHEQFTAVNQDGDQPDRARVSGLRSRLAWLALFVGSAVMLSAWLGVSTGVPDVSASAVEASSGPQVLYFPGQYVNQATEISAAPATF